MKGHVEVRHRDGWDDYLVFDSDGVLFATMGDFMWSEFNDEYEVSEDDDDFIESVDAYMQKIVDNSNELGLLWT